MLDQKGVIHLFLPLLLILIVIAAAIYFIFFNKNSNLPNFTNLQKKEPVVAVKTEYKNPFKKTSQYVNPFDQYKSPFLKFEK